MITTVVTEEDLTALRYGRFQQPDQRVHMRMEALYLHSQGVTKGEILRLCGMPNASFQRDLKAYVRGGIEQLKRIEHYRPPSEQANHCPTLEAYFPPHPPATVADAAANTAAVTGMVRTPRRCGSFCERGG